MPNSEGDFKLRGWSERFVPVLELYGCIDVDAVLGIMVDDGILPGPASKSSVTSMLNLDGDGCSAAAADGAAFDKRFDGDAAVFIRIGFIEDDMYLSFDVEVRGILSFFVK